MQIVKVQAGRPACKQRDAGHNWIESGKKKKKVEARKTNKHNTKDC